MYENWKILKTESNEKAEEYSQVAEWCNENGKYLIEDDGEFYKVVRIPEPLPPTEEEQKENRARAYKEEVDPLMAEYNRKKTFNLFEEGEEEALLIEVEDRVEEIKQRYPYPEEKSVEPEPEKIK